MRCTRCSRSSRTIVKLFRSMLACIANLAGLARSEQDVRFVLFLEQIEHLFLSLQPVKINRTFAPNSLVREKHEAASRVWSLEQIDSHSDANREGVLNSAVSVVFLPRLFSSGGKRAEIY